MDETDELYRSVVSRQIHNLSMLALDALQVGWIQSTNMLKLMTSINASLWKTLTIQMTLNDQSRIIMNSHPEIIITWKLFSTMVTEQFGLLCFY